MNLEVFFEEKDLDIQCYEVEIDGWTHIITTDVVIEKILSTKGDERAKISNILLQLDICNGDIHHFFRHLAKAIAAQYHSNSMLAK